MTSPLACVVSANSETGDYTTRYVISPAAPADEARRFESEIAKREELIDIFRVTQGRGFTALALWALALLAALVVAVARWTGMHFVPAGWHAFAPAVTFAILGALIIPHRFRNYVEVPKVEVVPQFARALTMPAYLPADLLFGSPAHRALWDYAVAADASKVLADALREWKRAGVSREVRDVGKRQLDALEHQRDRARERYADATADLSATAQAEALLAQIADGARSGVQDLAA